MQEQTVWIVGDWQQPEFAAAIAWLQTRARCAAFLTAKDAVGTESSCPAAIVVAQSRPGQFSRQDIERLHAAAPLARLIALVGPWCEGEARSGRPWPGVVRVSWRSWSSQLPRELGIGQSATAVRLPRTTTEAERLASTVAGLRRQPASNFKAAICTANRSEYESLREALAVLGMTAVWWQPAQQVEESQVNVMLVDGWKSAPGYVPAMPPCVLLLSFPRPQDIDRADALGIAAVVARPLLLADLAATLDDVMPEAAVRRESAA